MSKLLLGLPANRDKLSKNSSNSLLKKHLIFQLFGKTRNHFLTYCRFFLNLFDCTVMMAYEKDASDLGSGSGFRKILLFPSPLKTG